MGAMAQPEVCGGPPTSKQQRFRGAIQLAPGMPVVLPPERATPLDLANFLGRRHAIPSSTPTVLKVKTSTNISELEHRRQEISLTRTKFLDSIAKELEQSLPDWFSIMRSLQGHPFSREVNNLQGRIAELHVDLVLRNLAKSDKFRGSIQLKPLDNLTSGPYTFQRYNGGGITAVEDGTQLAEFDNLALVGRQDPVPTVVEVKVINAAEWAKQSDHFLSDGHLRGILEPVKHKFGDRVAVMYVTTQEGLAPQSKSQREFIRRGGYLVVMKPSLADFRYYAKQISHSPDMEFELQDPRR